MHLKSSTQRVLLKADWAKEHLTDLEEEVTGWLEANRDIVGCDTDSQSGEKTYKIVNLNNLPERIPLLIGDVIQNLRSCLDHLTWALAGGSAPNARNVIFPVSEAPEQYMSAVAKRVGHVGADVRDKFERLESHKGGQGQILWELASLSNIDKHRLLIATGLSLKSRPLRFTPSGESIANREVGTVLPVAVPPNIVAHPGQELFRDPAYFKEDESLNVTFDVAFDEAAVRGEPFSVIAFLQDATNAVVEVARFFDPEMP